MKRSLLLLALGAPLWAHVDPVTPRPLPMELQVQYTNSGSFGGGPDIKLPTKTALRVSQAVFVSSQALDLASNWNGPEANRFLATDGRMGAKGQGIKIGFAIGVPMLENWAIRKWPASRRAWIVLNFIVGSAHAGVAVRNWRTK